MGVRGTMQTTPMMIMMVVTMEEVAMAMVEMISPSSLLALTPFCSRALRAQGREKSATYRQYLGNRLFYSRLFALYREYGLIDGQEE